MRLTGGIYGGRTIVAPQTHATRPMTDKARQAIFNALGDVEGLAVLDVYAGSGAMGLEAVSRGAGPVVAVESARLASQAIAQNSKSLGLAVEFRPLTMTVESYLARNPGDRFDLIIADPPYAQLNVDVVERLGGLLNASGLLVVSHSARHEAPELGGLSLVRTRVYGDTGISLYRATEA